METVVFLVIRLPVQEAESFEDERLRAKRHLLNESWGENTDRESARESANTSASAKGHTGLGVEATLTDRVLHENVSCANSV